MKKAMMAFGVLAVMCGSALAYEVEGNPDRKISFGVNYDHFGTNSEYKFGSLNISDFTKVTENSVFADVKIPLASIFTFQIRGGYVSSNNDIFTTENISANGYDIGFGVRIYIP